jgi:hypothetical protein
MWKWGSIKQRQIDKQTYKRKQILFSYNMEEKENTLHKYSKHVHGYNITVQTNTLYLIEKTVKYHLLSYIKVKSFLFSPRPK